MGYIYIYVVLLTFLGPGNSATREKAAFHGHEAFRTVSDALPAIAGALPCWDEKGGGRGGSTSGICLYAGSRAFCKRYFPKIGGPQYAHPNTVIHIMGASDMIP